MNKPAPDQLRADGGTRRADLPASAYQAEELRTFAADLFRAAGLESEIARTVANVLVEADLMGHTTHGLALASRYLDEIAGGSMTCSGGPEVISDRGACVCWNGRRLPGTFLAAEAVDLAVARAAQYGTVTVVIANSHHIGCLAAYLMRATSKKYMAIVASSDPSQASVAPFGGVRAVFTPNPIAVGIPTEGDPILIDTSASITTNNMAARVARNGERFSREWLLDAEGFPSDDPKVLKDGGTILPAGGVDHGQKGYSWALLVEALTQGLAGFGRADGPEGWGASVFVQVIDPAAFGGSAPFERQTTWLSTACRSNPPRPGFEAVRVPGQEALRKRVAALAEGVAIDPTIESGLKGWAEKLDVPLPKKIERV